MRTLGIEELSRKLNTPDTIIQDWRMGVATMPERKWFQLIDILMGIDPN